MKKLYDERTPFRVSPWSLDLSINTKPLKDAHVRFYALFQFQLFFGHFLLLSEIKTKLIKFCTKLQMKQKQQIFAV